jgi:hypothetical protein
MAVNVFVSYSEKDHMAATLVSTLRGNPQVHLFIADEVKTPGTSIHQKVDLALQQAHVFLLLWSERSQASKWVSYEIDTALRLEKRILPVLVDGCALPESLADIEAVPLYKDSRNNMHLIAERLRTVAAPKPRPLGFSWASIAKAGLAAAIGLAAAWSESSAKAAPKPGKKAPARRKSTANKSTVSKAAIKKVGKKSSRG